MINVFSAFVAVSFAEVLFVVFLSLFLLKAERKLGVFISICHKTVVCTVSERKLTSLWRLEHLTDCLSWEDQLVSSVSLFAISFSSTMPSRNGSGEFVH